MEILFLFHNLVSLSLVLVNRLVIVSLAACASWGLASTASVALWVWHLAVAFKALPASQGFLTSQQAIISKREALRSGSGEAWESFAFPGLPCRCLSGLSIKSMCIPQRLWRGSWTWSVRKGSARYPKNGEEASALLNKVNLSFTMLSPLCCSFKKTFF